MKSQNKTLFGMVGAVAGTIAIALITQFEGVKLEGYKDPAGIPTKCMGDTNDVEVGKIYTTAECFESLELQIVEHAGPVLECTPVLEGRTFQLAAAISFAYNIGVGAYCRSDTAERFNAYNFRAACRAINENDYGKPQWVTSKGKVLLGLVSRRAAERALCELGLDGDD